MTAPAQFPCGGVCAGQLQTIDGILTSASAPRLQIDFARASPKLLIIFGKGLPGQVPGGHPSATPSMGILQIVRAHQRRVLKWLIDGEMRHQPAIAKREGIAIYHENAAVSATTRDHFTRTTSCIGVATQQIEPAPRRSAGPGSECVSVAL
jgi:hypothetical protein